MTPQNTSRRGQAMIAGLMMTSLLGFSALSIDVGTLALAGNQLQVSLDAATLGAAGRLDGTEEGLDAAVRTAEVLAKLNPVFGHGVAIGADDVETGRFEDGVFTQSADAAEVNAVRVSTSLDGVGTFFANAAFGIKSLGVQATSLSHRPLGGGPAGEASCFLPFAVPDCHLDGVPEGASPAPLQLTFSNDNVDDVGWGDPDANPNSSGLRDQLRQGCTDAVLAVGEDLNVSNGVNTSVLKAASSILNDRDATAPTEWPNDLLGPVPPRAAPTANDPSDSSLGNGSFGNVIEGPVALIDAGADCSGVKFTHTYPISGIGYGYIYDLSDKGKDKNLWLQIDIVNEYEIFAASNPDAVGANVLGLGDPQLAR